MRTLCIRSVQGVCAVCGCFSESFVVEGEKYVRVVVHDEGERKAIRVVRVVLHDGLYEDVVE